MDKFKMVLGEIEALFQVKNGQYGKDDSEGAVKQDRLYNFRQSAIRQFGSDSKENMIKVLNCYVDKHLVTLAKNGISDSTFEERCKDVIVYHVIAIMINREDEQ